MNPLRYLNVFILFIITLIVSMSVIVLISAANGHFYPWASKQLQRFIFGIGVMILASAIPIKQWLSYSYLLYFLSLLLLIFVELLGVIGMGAQRWVNLYIFNLQPSELMKVTLILSLARYFQCLTLKEIKKINFLIFPFLMVIIPFCLVLRQPDLGTALLLIFSSAAVFFVAGVENKVFLTVGGGGALSFPFFWHFLHAYQKKRIITFLNPEQDPLNSGYHVMQSKIALGSGGIFGKGFLKGTQSHLNFLPEKQTDFIFTMFCEEFGFLGAIILLLLYVILIAYGIFVALQSRNRFGSLLVIGLTTTLFLYVFINICMVMGLMPVVGIPLPLFSYGGTSLITILLSQGIIFSAYLEGKRGRL